MGIGNKLQKLIEEKNTNVNELAGRANVSPSTLYSIIKRDNTKVDIDVLISICKVLGVPVEYFSETSTNYSMDPKTAELAKSIKQRPKIIQLNRRMQKLSDTQLKDIEQFTEFIISRDKEKSKIDDDI